MKIPERQPVSAVTLSPPVLGNERLAQLFAEHYRRVLMAALRITGNIADAEDVAQAVFVRLGTGEGPSVSNAASYLYRAAINGALDLIRRRKTAAQEPLESAEALRSTDAFSLPEADMMNKELGRRLRQAIGELAPRAAEMFALRYLEDLSHGEIAKLMGTSQAVVAVTLYQSRSKLKKRLMDLERRMR
jgi:RNA polymerase sigma-70 factor, ECF subfamily